MLMWIICGLIGFALGIVWGWVHFKIIPELEEMDQIGKYFEMKEEKDNE